MDFQDTYHAVLGIPCFVKFMVVPHYAYLKMKMLGPNDVITISGDLQTAYQLIYSLSRMWSRTWIRRGVSSTMSSCKDRAQGLR
jgi:hypothetical protein